MTEAGPMTRSASRKSLVFAGAAALGCAVAALVGEPFLRLTGVAGGGTATCLLIDTSSSMIGGSIEEVREAAIAYARRQQFDATRCAVVSFDSNADVKVPLTADREAVIAACRELTPNGTTELAKGLREAGGVLASAPWGAARRILIFTDGKPDSPADAVAAAAQLRGQGVTIAAIRTQDAGDNSLFREVTGDDSLVFDATAGSFGKAFEAAERRLGLGDASGGSWIYEAIRFGIYSGLLALGVVLAVLAAQNAHLGKRWIDAGGVRAIAPAGFGAGLAAGAAASIYFSFSQNIGAGLAALRGLGVPTLLMAALAGWLVNTFLPRGEAGWRPRSRLAAAIGVAAALAAVDWLTSFRIAGGLVAGLTSAVAQRPLGWMLLGGLVAFGIARLIPNLPVDRAVVSGVAGGLCGGLAFVLLDGLLPNSPVARLVAAGALGASIGLAVAIVEAVCREYWLEIGYGKGESRTVTLGREPVSIGSDEKTVTVYARNAAAQAFRYRVADGSVRCEDCATGRVETVPVGDARTAGVVTITVRGGSRAAAGTAPAKPAAGGGAAGSLALRIGERPPIALAVGRRITAAEIPGVGTGGREQTVAEVVANPAKPGVLGLRNLSGRDWSITTPTGATEVAPNKVLPIAPGTKIDFGGARGVIA